MLRGFHHVGLSVGDLDRSIDFYCDVVGFEIERQGPFGGNEEFDELLGLSGAQGRAAMLRAGDLRLELFEFLSPLSSASRGDRPVSDQGITHFCIEVDDIERTYERLKRLGVGFHGPPLAFPAAAATAAYARDPDGNVFELIECS